MKLPDNSSFEDAQLLDITDNEFRIYKVLIEYGAMSISQIAKNASMNQRSCYDYLGRLVHKGLVGWVMLNGSKHFFGLNPAMIRYMIEEKKESLAKGFSTIRDLQSSEYDETELTYIADKKAFLKHVKQLDDKATIIIGSRCDSIVSNPNFQYFMNLKGNEVKNLKDVLKHAPDRQLPASVIIILAAMTFTIFSVPDEIGFCAKSDDFVKNIRCYFG